ncbi:NAD(P)H-dependent flavin oxidoreductase [Chitinophaga nivalis]|uniref:Propionate 3-nitronate monooxygenase n=1 Tax=Chitinophaga nivalis TaxID=2991709 RepID=A0ABT3IL23_9BACT|nr:nitronate monooxygenase [Chitinophaga nivalis]MCW3465647.1 nitronate monooxygenase [Chitinophaga nivalis]MCW3484662.1 nitronate monooxygenase [Chitinophaga nivalis]
MQWQNELTRMLGIRYPLVQAPMLGITTPAMVAAISNSGGLGSLPVGGLPPAKVASLIREVKALTKAPFAVNLFTYELPSDKDPVAFDQMQAFLQFLYGAHQIMASPVALNELQFYSYRDQLPVLLEEGVQQVSFTFGIPDAAAIALLQSHQILLTGTATSVAEAVALEAAGVNVIVVQGIEAGGHRGSFLTDTLPQTGTLALVPQVVDRVGVPVIAAGGIMDGRGIAAARMLGAAGMQSGSVYLRSDESAATPAHKRALAGITDTTTRLTRAMSGRWARGVPNTLINEVDIAALAINPYPIQDALTQPVRRIAKEQDNPAFIAMWAGQAAGKAKALPAAVIFQEMLEEAAALLGG